MQPSEKDETGAKDGQVPHDCFRQVYLGQLSDPVYPPHPEAPEAEEDELTRAALSDPEAKNLHRVPEAPTIWRVVAAIFFALLALGVVFILR